MPVKRAEPIIDHEMFALIQKKLQANSDRSGPRVNSSPLLRVAFCGSCGAVMYTSQTKSGGKTYRYYECANARDGKCGAKKMRAELVEDELKRMVLGEVGSRKMTRKVVISASDNSAKLKEVEKAIAAWEAKAILGENADSVSRILDGLKARQARLVAEGSRPEEVRWEETAETVREHWNSVQDLNAFLRDKGVTIHVRRAKKGEGPSFRGEGTLLAQLAERKVLPPLQAEERGLIAKVYLADLNALATA